MNRARSCFCNQCFYCFIQDDGVKNLDKLSQLRLTINVAEYVGPETARPNKNTGQLKLSDIPIHLCTSAHNE
jgi:hypothetical protein